VRAGSGVGIAFESELTAVDQDLKFIPVDDANLSAYQFLVAMPALAQTSLVKQFYEIVRESTDSSVFE
jgi:hypothetical protein